MSFSSFSELVVDVVVRCDEEIADVLSESDEEDFDELFDVVLSKYFLVLVCFVGSSSFSIAVVVF